MKKEENKSGANRKTFIRSNPETNESLSDAAAKMTELLGKKITMISFIRESIVAFNRGEWGVKNENSKA